MNKLKLIFNIIIGSMFIYLSILFLAVAIDSPFLAVIGLIIAPTSIIYFNKKFKVKPLKYYSILFGVMVATLLSISPIIKISANNTYASNKQDEVIENKNEEIEEIKEEENSSNVIEENEKVADTVILEKEEQASTYIEEDIFAGYTLIEVDGGDLSGYREPNVVVDIGFGDRKYYAFTNEYGQLVKVIAKEIILQDDSTEPVNSSGRYYSDEAKVPGVESSNLDEGHVIADSLGGVSNAYNITPQNSTLNRHGDQAYMEKVIRDAGGCTDFIAIITYKDTTTQIPSHYSYTYTINGNVINDEFDNINPDEYNANLESNSSVSRNNESNSTNINNSSESSNIQSDVNSSKVVYWTPGGNSYHSTKNCSTLSRSKTVLEGTIEQSGKNDPCDICKP